MFKFQNTLADNQFTVGGKKVSIPLAQNGSGDVNTPGSSALNVHETFQLFVYYGPRAMTTPAPVTNVTKGGTTFDKPVDYIGAKTISNYVAYANQHIWEIAVPGCSSTGRVFVGQRKDPFRVNLGETFDLVNIKYPATELLAGAEFATVDSLHDSNVTALALELPIACLTQGKGDIIGGWTTSSVPALRSLLAHRAAASIPRRKSATTSRCPAGAPLVNEVVIGLRTRTSSTGATQDDGQFATYVTNPTLPMLLEILFGGAGVKAPTNFPRTDLVAAFLTGISGLNQPANVVASEQLRLNTSIAPTPMSVQSRFGVIGGDNAGFPNGRRPGDDVVDIELRVAMGVLCTLNIGGCTPADAPAGSLHYTDGAYTSWAFFEESFPYLRAH
jgi:hypothetical protein